MLECSVIMAVYNAAKTVEETVATVLAQRDVDFEIIAVEDGSKDDSFEILNRLAAQASRAIERSSSRERR
jgi:glycosyltransferase involved in cell wall biosynthesis